MKISTLNLRRVAIAHAHRAAGQESPTEHPGFRQVWRGIRRTRGTAPERKAPLLTEDLRRMIGALPATMTGTRDRALILVGFAGAFRRSELVDLDVEDVEFTAEGAIVTIRRSKADQEGEGTRKGVANGRNQLCPVLALRRWLEAAAIEQGLGLLRRAQARRHASLRGVS